MIKNQLIDNIFSTLDAKRYVAEQLADDNMKTAMSNIELKKCYNYIRSLEYEIAKVDYQKQDSRLLRNDLKLWKQKKDEILKSMNINENELFPKYDCNICHDTGMVGNQYCVCFKKLLSLSLLLHSGLKKEDLKSFAHINYDMIDPKYVENTKSIYNLVEKFINELSTTNYKIITISGPTGVGKTHLAYCAVNAGLSNGYYTYYTTAFKLGNDMLNYHCSKFETKAEIIAPYLDCELLVIDDLGTEPMLQNVTKEYLYLILNERRNRNAKTIITSNLLPNEILDRYEERIFSRLSNKAECILLYLDGDDLRLKRH